MRILFGMPAADSWGGPAACEPPFVEAITSLGIESVTETYVYGDKDRVTNLLGRISRVIKTALRIRKVVSTSHFNLVHLNTAFDRLTILRDSVTVFFMGRKRPKLFLKIHGSGANFIEPTSLIYRALIRYLDKRVAGYGIFTHEELETFLTHGIDRGKFHFVKNAVRVESEHQKNTGERNSFKLIFVSRFIETKGLIETIEAARLAKETGAEISLVCVGDGPIRADAESLVKSYGIGDLVEFTGYVREQEVDRKLSESDVFVFPTRHNEGFPIAMFKAAICGLPIITTRVRAAAEYFEDRKNCLFCSSEPADIADKIIELINNKELRLQMARANRDFQGSLSPPNIAGEYLKIYEKLIKGN